MAFKFSNIARARLTDTLAIGATECLVDISGAETLATAAQLSGGNTQRCRIQDDTQDFELVDITANPGDGTLTLVRARESTAQKEWPAGSLISQYLSQAVLESLQ